LITTAQAPAEILPTTTTVVFSHTVPAGAHQAEHAHPYHQLCWSPRGTYVLEVHGRVWHLSPATALWIPAWVPHAFGADGALALIDSKHEPRRCTVSWTRPRVVAVGVLTAALLRHLADPAVGAAERERAEEVLYDQLLAAVDEHATALRRPTDPRARIVADELLRDPADDRSLDDWGVVVSSSRRTLSRLFRDETSLSFTAWRATARMQIAAARIAGGQRVGTTARQVGYRDTGSFIAAFRRTYGTTPGVFPVAGRAGTASEHDGGRPVPLAAGGAAGRSS
jgi:AraC-like DNA-binding protein